MAAVSYSVKLHSPCRISVQEGIFRETKLWQPFRTQSSYTHPVGYRYKKAFSERRSYGSRFVLSQATLTSAPTVRLLHITIYR